MQMYTVSTFCADIIYAMIYIYAVSKQMNMKYDNLALSRTPLLIYIYAARASPTEFEVACAAYATQLHKRKKGKADFEARMRAFVVSYDADTAPIFA